MPDSVGSTLYVVGITTMQKSHWGAWLAGLLLGLAGSTASAAVKVKDIAGQWRCTNLSSQYVLTQTIDASGAWQEISSKAILH